MKEQQGGYCMQMKLARGKTEQIRDVCHLVVGSRGEVDPPEDQGKGDGDGKQTAPEDELMHRPAKSRTLRNEGLRKQMRSDEGYDAAEASKNTVLPE